MFPDDAEPGIRRSCPTSPSARTGGPTSSVACCTHATRGPHRRTAVLDARRVVPHLRAPFTLALVRHKLAEANLLDRAEFVTLADGARLDIGPFDCEFLPVTHSTPSGVISVLRTPQGIIVHSGDLKIDPTPVDGRVTNLDRLDEIASTEGVRLLLADSTNADTPGRTQSETHVGDVLAGVFAANRDRRIIVASFASHIHRMQQVANLAIEQGRTVVPVGLSMVRNVKLARDLGLMHIPDAHIADADEAERIDPADVCVICTGSQGEYRSALWQMVQGENRFVSIIPDDTVVFSSHPIPGNEAAVARLRNGLARLGAEVVHSGHSTCTRAGTRSKTNWPTSTTSCGRSSSSRCTVRTPTWPPTPSWRARSGHAGGPCDRVRRWAERGAQRRRAVVGPRSRRTMIYVDGRSAASTTTCCTNGSSSARTGSWRCSRSSIPRTARWLEDPRVVSAGWATDSDARRSRSGHRDRSAQRAYATAHRTIVKQPDRTIERAVRRAAGVTVNDRTRRRPMIVPVVTYH